VVSALGDVARRRAGIGFEPVPESVRIAERVEPPG
jgi:hypothetical protein